MDPLFCVLERHLANRTSFAVAWARIAPLLPDFREVLVAFGLFALARGVWMIYPAAAWVLVGLVLMVLGLFGVPKWPSS